MTDEVPYVAAERLDLSPAEDLARALARFLTAPPSADPWAKYPPVLYVPHVADIMGMNERAVSEAARRGNLPMKKRLGRYAVPLDVFRAWLVAEATP